MITSIIIVGGSFQFFEGSTPLVSLYRQGLLSIWEDSGFRIIKVI